MLQLNQLQAHFVIALPLTIFSQTMRRSHGIGKKRKTKHKTEQKLRDVFQKTYTHPRDRFD